MQVYEYELKAGISRTKEFEKKQLAQFAVNTGLKCGHGCKYGSTGTMLRAHHVFKKLPVSPFDNNYAIVDPDIAERVARDARRKRKRGLVELCTIVDAWSPEAQKYDLGRKCLQAILAQPGWKIRILTKNIAVRKEFDVIEKYKDRVLFGMSITACPEKNDVISAIEPFASSINERIELMKEAARRDFRVYAMFCPILPGIADLPHQLDELVQLAREWKAEEIFTEPVNSRGRGLILTRQALKSAGFHCEATCVDSIRYRDSWSQYVVRLIKNMQHSVRKYYDIKKLRLLLYPDRLQEQDLNRIRENDAGVIWLGNDQ